MTQPVPTTGSRSTVLGYLSLFTSFGTLLLLSRPSLLVLVGLGATVASVLSSVPWLVTLSRHKNWVFGLSGVLIAGNFLYVYAIAPKLVAQVHLRVRRTTRAPATRQPERAALFFGFRARFTL